MNRDDIILSLDFAHGSSFLLFIVSTIQSFLYSKLISWKLSNIFLVVSSYLCNATKYKRIFLLMNYFSIILVSTSYLNNMQFNTAIYLCAISEYSNTGSITNAKDVAFGTTLIKAITNTYLYVDTAHFAVISGSSILGLAIYHIRLDRYKKGEYDFNIALTWAFHICIVSIIYIASITAV